MIKVRKEGVILAPTSHEFENLSTYNPGIIQEGEYVHMIYRAQDQKYMSYFGYAKLKGPLNVIERWKKPLYVPEFKYEKKGIEDPRIVKIGNTYYVIYVAHDGRDALMAYMYGENLFELKRGGIISPTMSYRRAAKLFHYSDLKDKYYFFAAFYEKYADKNVLVWEKDGVLFPELIKGKFLLMHRILPDIQIAKFSDFKDLKDQNYWHDHLMHLGEHVMLEGAHGWEARHIGGGAPPVKTKKGWLVIYHGVEPKNAGRIYHCGAALFDLENPLKLIARLPYPLIKPEDERERFGHVHNVVFPTGTSIFKNRLYIYYGAADSYVAAASINLNSLVNEILKYKTDSQ